MAEDSSALRKGPGWRALRWAIRTPRATFFAALGVALVGFLVGYLLSVVAFFPSEETPGDLVLVPKVVGREVDESRRLLESRQLAYREAESLHHPSVPAGRVTAQDPLPGQFLVRGDTVDVTVSRGPEQRAVPYVVGLKEEQALAILRHAGFEGAVESVDADADVGRVVQTRPESGRRLELPARVVVVVSAGPRTVVVPDLLSRSLVEARATLERLGLRLGRVIPDSSADAAPGTVLAQNPLPGTSASRGDSVSVAVAGERLRATPAADSTEARSDGGV